MSDARLVHERFKALERDVRATTDVSIALTDWLDPADGIGAVIHEAGTEPTSPVWEVLGYLGGGDCLATHPPQGPHVQFPLSLFPLSADRGDITVDLATQAQDLVQTLLWLRGLDPTWPPCPEQDHRHPLRAAQHWSLPDLGADTARWECPHGTFSTRIGDLQ